MNALQPQPDPSPSRQVRARARSRSRQRQSPYQALAIEATAKLSVNLVLSLVAVVTLARLIPYNLKQQNDLQRLQSEVDELAMKVASLQEDFDRHFDPQQALNVMQEQNIRSNPQQRQIVWLNPETKQAESTDKSQAENAAQAPD